jgi:HPt (histidine-containing phosphotransfer) domain-containing protein
VSDIDRAREALREYYEESLTRRLEHLEERHESFDPGDDEQVAAIRRLGHQLSGSAASFGFAELGRVGSIVETAPREQLPALIGALVDEVKLALAALRSGSAGE